MPEAEDRYKLLVERSPYCIHEIDLDARLQSMNAAGLAMMGVTDECEIVGVPYLDAVDDADRARVEALLHRALAGEASQFEFEASNGNIFASTFVPIFDKAGRVVRLMGLTHDVTEQRSLEAQVRQTQKLESIGQLAGGIAHDFNNLLQVVLAELDLAEDRLARGASCQASLQGIREAATRAAALTQRMLTLARRQPIDLIPSDLNALLEGQAAMAARVLPATIEVTFRGAPDLPHVRMNSVQIEEVMLNLCVNAQHAMPNGGTLEIETHRAPPSASGEFVEIVVRDDGVGMPPEVVERVFDPFFTTKGADGTGLGLSVAYGIVKQHGGSIRVRSAVGAGTEVTLRLQATDEPLPVPAPAESATPRAQGETVLVAEDNGPVRDLVARSLTEAGYVVLQAADGQEALDMLARHDEIRLALLDVVMPRKNGVEVCDVILANHPGVHVLFTSGHSADTVSAAYLEAHQLQLLRKPYAPAVLVRTVTRVLRHEVPARA